MDTITASSLVGPVLAPQFFGTLFNWALYGVLACQTYHYYLNFGRDKRTIQGLVYVIFALETAQSGLVAHDAFAILVRGWGDTAAALNPEHLWLTAPIMDGIIGTATQLFYAYRILVLSRSRVLCGTICVFSMVALAGSIADGIQSNQGHAVVNVGSAVNGSAIAWLVGTISCDALISAYMLIWYLRIRSTLVYKTTTDIVTYVLRITVISGCLTTITAVVLLSVQLSFSNAFYEITPGLVMAKLYSNSLLALRMLLIC
ncbi:hypothetical protein K488DRAFT_82174 [Vararia minispora EC-137]|uniref:Uncharacterized protein n=1 Tax=Vararia minispora EC-137 TaxID=1314806 RepID=A0ACB8QYF8_9AGAM|nr:hypothetical protein K488DRAFT_82174 [Vararia minispora EC-137]